MAPDKSNQQVIREVWRDNVEEEIAYMRELVDKYPVVSIDTEFPGVVARPVGPFRSSSEYQYQTLRVNVDMLKLIQLGVTLSDENGNVPPGICTWQFNFAFNLQEEAYAQDSIELLTRSGVDFMRLSTHGIDVQLFGELLITSGFVLMDNVTWVAFHGTYDMGYLLKVLTAAPLPEDEGEFFELLHTFFPNIYDIKYMMKSCKNLKGGLQEVADNLAVERIGPQHQAGSDSLLTLFTFFKMRKAFFEDDIDDAKYRGHLYGLSSVYPAIYYAGASPAAAAALHAAQTAANSSNGNGGVSSSSSTTSLNTGAPAYIPAGSVRTTTPQPPAAPPSPWRNPYSTYTPPATDYSGNGY